jgi:hypothetical protein
MNCHVSDGPSDGLDGDIDWPFFRDSSDFRVPSLAFGDGLCLLVTYIWLYFLEGSKDGFVIGGVVLV